MKAIGLIKETQLTQLVALTPANIKALSKHSRVFVESKAGEHAGFMDKDYEIAGATICKDSQVVVSKADLLVTFSSPIQLQDTEQQKTVIGFFDCLNDFSVLIPFKHDHVDLHSLNFIPRSSLAQSMDILSTVASISGYQAVLRASSILSSVVPMITSAGGTLPHANFLILGAGVAGLQAIATAKRLGARVKAFDVRAATKTEVESLGAKFIEVEGAKQNDRNDGYAVEQDADYLSKLETKLLDEIKLADAIITTAKIPGKKAPILIKEAAVMNMKKGAVIIDLAAENEGNCACTSPGQIVEKHGVIIDGRIHQFADLAKAVSTTIGQNFTSFIEYYLAHTEEKSDEILGATTVIQKGKITHKKVLEEIELI